MLPASSCKSSCKCYLVDSHLLLQHVPALGVFFFKRRSHSSPLPGSSFTSAGSLFISEVLLRLVELPLDLGSVLLVLCLGRLDQDCEDGLFVSFVLPSVAEPSSKLGPTSSASR